MSQAIHPLRFYTGTTAERGAFSPPPEALGASWWDTDRELMYVWTATAWIGVHALTSPDGAIDPVLSADNSGNVTLAGTGTLTIPSDIIHAGDVDTKMAFTTDQWDLTVGGVNMIRADETTQDVLYLGDVGGAGDVDVSFNNGQIFLRGSDGFLGIDTILPDAKVEINAATASEIGLILQSTDDSVTNELLSVQLSDDTEFLNFTAPVVGELYRVLTIDITGVVTGERSLAVGLFYDDDSTDLTSNISSGMFILNANNSVSDNYSSFMFSGKTSTGTELTFGHIACVMTDHTHGSLDADLVFVLRNVNSLTRQATLKNNGFFGINGVIAPATALDIGAGAMTFAEMTAPGAGAVNEVRLYAVDNGAGKTQLMAIFNTGAAQQVAIQP